MTICFSMAIGAHILVKKLIVTISMLIVGCVDVRSCVEVPITWQVVGYLRCMICHELA